MEEEEDGGWRMGEGEIYVCVAGDAVVEGAGRRRETAGPIIDGALLGQRPPQGLAGPVGLVPARTRTVAPLLFSFLGTCAFSFVA